MVDRRDQSPLAAGDVQLREALERVFFNFFNGPTKIVRLDRCVSEYSSSFAIEELEVELDNDRLLALIFKDLSSRALLDDARRIKPDFLFNPRREIDVYRSILSQSSHGTASCYGSEVNESNEQFWLFLEKVQGIELYQVGEFDVWLEIAKWLGGFHNSHQEWIECLANEVPLIRYDRGFYRTWLDRLHLVLRTQHAAKPSQIQALTRCYRRVIERLLQLPFTLLHGDFYPSNVMVQSNNQALRICVVDWEMAAAGPGVIDLAALVSGGWTEQQETALILAYMNSAFPGNVNAPERKRFVEDVARGQLHLAMQWLGWSPGWSPPEEHRQNWFQIALDIVERFEL